MDPSSVITQASPDSNNSDGSHLFHVQKDTKKKRTNFLCSIICCLGKKSTKFKKDGGGGGGGNGSASSSVKGGQIGLKPTGGGSNNGAGGSVQTDVQDQKSNSQSKSNNSSSGVGGGSSSKHLLPEIRVQDAGKKCIVIDLDETLVHSSFKPISNADFIVPVEIDNVIHQVYVLKRPYVDEFLCKVGELFECVLFTASLAKYADPVADLLDKWDVFHSRLFRESCVFHRGNYVKDLSKLGRQLPQVIIVDNSPASYIFHPENAVPVASWFEDMNDRELLDLIPFLEQLSKVDSVYRLLKEAFNKSPEQPSHHHHLNNSFKKQVGAAAQAAAASVVTQASPPPPPPPSTSPPPPSTSSAAAAAAAAAVPSSSSTQQTSSSSSSAAAAAASSVITAAVS